MKMLVALSGGMDSATVLGAARDALRPGDSIEAVGFRYGSKHNRYENEAAQKVAGVAGVPFELIDFTEVMSAFSSNLLESGGEIPEGHYEEKTMSQTVVPGRNLIFISILTGLAWSKGANQVWLGIHSGDHAIYPDCRPTFFHAMNAAVVAGSDEKVELVAPFLHGNKTSIIAYGIKRNVPYYLTRTCYKHQPIACGRCGACQERLEAFANNGIPDPIEYESRDILPKGAGV